MQVENTEINGFLIDNFNQYDLKEGDTILKYGHDIGKVINPIKKGDHVHVHNVKTKKW